METHMLLINLDHDYSYQSFAAAQVVCSPDVLPVPQLWHSASEIMVEKQEKSMVNDSEIMVKYGCV